MKRTLEDIKYNEGTEELAKYAKALGHPTRIGILNYIKKKSSCYAGELIKEFPLAQSTISQHLKELKNAGLILGELKPPKIKYTINQDNWNTAQGLFSELFGKKH